VEELEKCDRTPLNFSIEKAMKHEPTKWMLHQTNPLRTSEDKLDWVVERLNQIQTLTALARGEHLTLDIVLEEVDTLVVELESGKMVDRGIVD
jgi:hypothetical protein